MTREEFLDRIDEIMCGTSNAERACLEDLYNEVVAPHWISVEDELPPTSDRDDESDDYLIIDSDGDKNVGYYNKMDEVWFSCDGHILDVTHWMPLPQAPILAIFAKTCKNLKGGEG